MQRAALRGLAAPRIGEAHPLMEGLPLRGTAEEGDQTTEAGCEKKQREAVRLHQHSNELGKSLWVNVE